MIALSCFPSKKTQNFITFIKLIFKWHARMQQKMSKSFWRYKSPLLFAVNQKNTLSQLSFHILIFNSYEDTLVWFPFFYTSSFMVFNSFLIIFILELILHTLTWGNLPNFHPQISRIAPAYSCKRKNRSLKD